MEKLRRKVWRIVKFRVFGELDFDENLKFVVGFFSVSISTYGFGIMYT